MASIYVDCVFELANETTHKVTIKDVKDDIGTEEMTALAALLIEKNSHHNGSSFVNLKSCKKYTVDVESLV